MEQSHFKNALSILDIQPKDRLSYIRALEQAQLGGRIDDFETVIAKAVSRSLDIYLKAIHQEEPTTAVAVKRGKLMKIGGLANRTGETVPTIRFWLKEGLLRAAQRTAGGHQLFDQDMIRRIRQGAGQGIGQGRQPPRRIMRYFVATKISSQDIHAETIGRRKSHTPPPSDCPVSKQHSPVIGRIAGRRYQPHPLTLY
ncbi:MAG: MerR family transcriptional regulator [Alphaproteobacteria bacterium]|nr:MerR family transcriptional regulator [Alphaproteobacteria bacterium]